MPGDTPAATLYTKSRDSCVACGPTFVIAFATGRAGCYRTDLLASYPAEIAALTRTTVSSAELPFPKLRDAVIAHLTYAEGHGALFVGIPERSA